MYTLNKKTDFKGLTNSFPSHYFFLEFLLNLGCTKSPLLVINGVITLINGRKQMGNGFFHPYYITYLELVFGPTLCSIYLGGDICTVKKKKSHPKSQHPSPPPNQTPPVCQETKATNSTQVFRHSWPIPKSQLCTEGPLGRIRLGIFHQGPRPAGSLGEKPMVGAG